MSKRLPATNLNPPWDVLVIEAERLIAELHRKLKVLSDLARLSEGTDR